MANEERVVVTGLGTVAPGCRGTDGFLARLLSGDSAIGPLTSGAAAGMGDRVGAEVELIDKRSLGMSRKELRYLDVVSTYGLIAARAAVASAGLDAGEALERDEIGFAIGLFSGPLSLSRHESNVNLFSAAMSAYYGSVIGNITIPLRICGPSSTHLNLDLAGTDAIGYGYELVRHGKARAVVAGGSDSGFNAFVLSRLQEAGVLSNGGGRSGPAGGQAGPGSGGVALGEGAALLVLESLESAESRGQEIHAEVLGYQTASNGCAPAAIETALAKAGLPPAAVDCIVANASGFAEIDRREVEAVRRVFGDAATQPWTTSITWAVGHTLGAAGALQAVASTLILKHQQVPPVGQPAAARERSGLNLVGPPGVAGSVRVVLQSSFGFSGKASFLVLGRYARSAGDD